MTAVFRLLSSEYLPSYVYQQIRQILKFKETSANMSRGHRGLFLKSEMNSRKTKSLKSIKLYGLSNIFFSSKKKRKKIKVVFSSTLFSRTQNTFELFIGVCFLCQSIARQHISVLDTNVFNQNFIVNVIYTAQGRGKNLSACLLEHLVFYEFYEPQRYSLIY